MFKRLAWIAPAVIAATVVAGAQDVKAVLDNVTKAMGAGGVTSVTYSGTAADVNFLQTKNINGPWPLRPITGYVRTIDLSQTALRSSGATNNQGLFGGAPVCGQLQPEHHPDDRRLDPAARLLDHAVGLPQGSGRVQRDDEAGEG